jgi:tetratricopeptide (TPR) repeat protein
LAPRSAPPRVFPDGIIYHNFYNQPRVDIALSNIVRAFGADPMPTAYDAADQLLAKKQALLVLDNVDQADDLPGLLEVHGNCGVLLLTQPDHELPVSGQIRQDVAPLPLETAVTLLEKWSETKALDHATARQVCQLVGQSPLAIRLIGHYLAARQETMAAYLAWLAQSPLAGLEPEQRRQTAVSVVLERSLGQVSQTAQQALGVMGLLALTPFGEQAVIKALTSVSEQGLLSTIKGIFKPKPEMTQPDVPHALNELVNYGLLWWRGQHPEISHPFIYTYARRHFSPPARVIRQLAAYYTTLAWEQSGLGPKGYERLDEERPHLMRVLNECLERTDWEAAHGLAAAIEDYLDRQGYWVERVIANEAGLVAAWQLGRPSEGAWLGNLGDTYRTMGHAKWAIEHFKKALETARRAGDPYSEANSLGNLGLAYRDLGQIDQAREYLQQSLAIFDRVNSPSADLVRDWLFELEEWEE